MFFALAMALAAPTDWVPARWNWTDPKSLELLDGSPINCLLVDWKDEAESLAPAAAARGVTTLAILTPAQADLAGAARRAVRARFTGIALEGDFPEGTAERVRDALADSKAQVIEITSRARLKLGGPAPVVATYQGVWAGIEVASGDKAKAAPTGGPWIDTNAGFIRAVRAWGPAAVWLGHRPPAGAVVTTPRYLQMISDCAAAGARWILALDPDFAARLARREPFSLKDWRRLNDHIRFFEDQKDWRALPPFGKLAIVQEPGPTALLTGGILDMIAVKHTPVRAVVRERLAPGALRNISMTVNVDREGLTPEQAEVLRGFARSGGTLLTGPPGWRGAARPGQVTVDKADIDRLNDIWREVNALIGRRNLGARLFNVSTVLSNLAATEDARQVIVHLVNYSEFPVESITVHVLGDYTQARLQTPEGAERALEVYKIEEGTGVEIDRVGVAATLRLN